VLWGASLVSPRRLRRKQDSNCLPTSRCGTDRGTRSSNPACSSRESGELQSLNDAEGAVKAKELLVAAGFPNGFDAGPFTVDGSYSNMAEAAVDYLQQVGIRCKLVPMERAAFASAYANKKLTSGIFRAASGAFGNIATRLAR
jgi:hypothetical protein